MRRPRLPRHARGYGTSHQARRRRLEPVVATGQVRCARGALCFFAEGELGGFIRPGEPWDLGHVDGSGKRLYSGPEHRRCNRATAGRMAGKVTSRNWLTA